MSEENKGLYEQLKNLKEEKPILTKEKLIQAFENVFNKPVDENRKVNLPLEWKYYEWEENGEKFSCWKLINGFYPVLVTGDKGKEEFDRIMKEDFNEQV